MAVVAALVTGLGFAVRYGEDNQVGSSNEVSWWVFVVAGLFAYWSVLGFFLSLFFKPFCFFGNQRVLSKSCFFLF